MRARFFPGDGPRWSDFMVARTRRHIGGCASGMEAALRFALEPHLPADLLDQAPHGLVWRAIEHDAGLLSPALFAHFRTRAALSLMAASRPSSVEDLSGDAPDDAVRDAALGLSLAVSRWQEAGAEHSPMRLDLPAEHFAELLWSASALLGQAIAAMDAMPVEELYAAIDAAAQGLLAGYDEQAGPLGQASLIAFRMGQAVSDTQLVALAQRGQFLLLCAIIAERCGIETEVVAQTIVHADPPHMLHALCRAADFPAQPCALFALALRCVRDGLSDEGVGALADSYDALSRDEAHIRTAFLTLSPPLRAMIGRIA